jgi:hypothetical protein
MTGAPTRTPEPVRPEIGFVELQYRSLTRPLRCYWNWLSIVFTCPPEELGTIPK